MNQHWNACDCHGPISPWCCAAARPVSLAALGGLWPKTGVPGQSAFRRSPTTRPAKRVIFLFMHGGRRRSTRSTTSRCLRHGKPLPFASRGSYRARRATCWLRPGSSTNTAAARLGERAVSAWPRSTIWLIRSMHASNSRHGGACSNCTPAAIRCSPQHGLVDHLWPGYREHDLPGFITIAPRLRTAREQFTPSCPRPTRARRWAMPASFRSGQDSVHRGQPVNRARPAAGTRSAATDGNRPPGAPPGTRAEAHRFVRAGFACSRGFKLQDISDESRDDEAVWLGRRQDEELWSAMPDGDALPSRRAGSCR